MVLGVLGLNLSLTCDNIPPVRSIITRPASPSLLACALMASASGCGIMLIKYRMAEELKDNGV